VYFSGTIAQSVQEKTGTPETPKNVKTTRPPLECLWSLKIFTSTPGRAFLSMKNTQIIKLQHETYETKTLVNVLVNALQGESTRLVNLGNAEETLETEEFTEFSDGFLSLLEDVSTRLEKIYRKLETFKHLPDPIAVANILDAVNFPDLQPVHHLQPSNGRRVAT
jgi:hypothetical protein